MKDFVVKYKFLILTIVLFVILRLPSLFEPYWYGDEGIYLVLGKAIRSGLTLYSQIHDNKPPTLYYLAALGQTVFGFRLLLAIWMIPTLFAFYFLVRKLFHKTSLYLSFFLFLITTSIPLIEGPIANAEIFMLLPTVLAFYLGLKAKKSDHKSWLLVGLLLGFAFTIKVPVAIECGFFFLWLLVTQGFSRKPWFLLLGFLLPIASCTLFYGFKGALLPFLKAALHQNIGYLSSWATGNFAAAPSSGGLFSRALFLLASWVILSVLYLKKKIDSQTHFLISWFAATIFASLLSGRPYPHYLIQTLPPLTLLIGSLFSKNHAKIVTTFSLILFVIITLKFNFYYYPVLPYYQNFYSYITNHRSFNDYQSFFSDQVSTTYKLAQYLQSKTTNSEKIFIWGDAPMVYALASRLPVGRFTVAYHIVDFNAYDETIARLKSTYPRYIIIYPMVNRAFPALDTFVNSYYLLEQSFGNNILVYQRRI